MRDRERTEDTVLPVERSATSRRSFLKLAGFGVGAATLAACERGPVRLVVPRLDAVEGMAPGRAYLVATTCGGCEARCGVLARCRDGRPVKLEGNPEHATSRGGLCAVGQAEVLELYDGQRFETPRLDGRAVSWEAVDGRVRSRLGTAAAGSVQILTRTVTSPSTRSWIARFREKYGAGHVEWDPRSASALLAAHEQCVGVRAVPRYRFEGARVIASFDADFLGTWISPVEFAKGYASGRRLSDDAPTMSRHVQIESRMSLTGASADERLVTAPWEIRPLLAALVVALAARAGADPEVPEAAAGAPHANAVARLASDLWDARGESLVVCGSDDAACQALALRANDLLGNLGRTVDLSRPALSRRGDDAALEELVRRMSVGEVEVLVIDGLDPVYELPSSLGFADALGKVGLVVTTSPRADDTSSRAAAIVPAPHELESWNDAEAVAGRFSLSQPTVPPLRSARTLRASLAAWLGVGADDGGLVRAHWREHVHPLFPAGSFDAFFDRALHDGYVALDTRAPDPATSWRAGALRRLVGGAAPGSPPDGSLALLLYPKVGLPEGRHAHNPWLQELADPLTTVTWENYACLAPATAESMGLADGDVVRLSAEGTGALELPVRVMPGQHPRTVAVALGYGVAGTDRFSRIGPSWLEGRLTVRDGERVGRRAADLLSLEGGHLRFAGRAVRLERTGAAVEMAATQDHHSLEVPHHLAPRGGEVRGAVLQTTIGRLRDDPAHAIHRHEHPAVSLWPDDHVTDGPRWGMVVDLAACNGCSGCVVACQAENNVPGVGKDEVHRHREMTWLRMDRYFTGEGDGLRVNHQPMMCQHCENAPCETVCPVLATVHSEDGLNQQVYNRCVGTRYCANNCPYKTRRFNWFDYPRREELRNLALNPDVTVRTRGVMEKCSMCIQRIQEGKSEARRTGRPLADGDVRTACQQSCPADAITFGDLNDPESAVARLARGPRAYAVLSELNVRPGVTYLADVVNGPEREARHG